MTAILATARLLRKGATLATMASTRRRTRRTTRQICLPGSATQKLSARNGQNWPNRRPRLESRLTRKVTDHKSTRTGCGKNSFANARSTLASPTRSDTATRLTLFTLRPFSLTAVHWCEKQSMTLGRTLASNSVLEINATSMILVQSTWRRKIWNQVTWFSTLRSTTTLKLLSSTTWFTSKCSWEVNQERSL